MDSKSTRPRSGVLLVNLGTPDAPTAPAVRRYLREFLSDSRVVEIPRAIWLPILYGFILPFRPRKVAEAYAEVWTETGSPLLVNTEALAQALRSALGDIPVAVGMTYGNPSIDSGLEQLLQQDVEHVLVLPLFPQYSSTTTAASFDVLAAAMARRRVIPGISMLRDYATHPGYICALANSVRQHRERSGDSGHLLMSFHGIPKRNTELGDPYARQCEATAQALADELGLQDGQWTQAYQSRFGKAEWLKPYADLKLAELARAGIEQIDVICPGFPADCLETLEEIAQRYAKDYLAAGGKTLRYIPALNGGSEHAAALASLLQPTLRNAQ